MGRRKEKQQLKRKGLDDKTMIWLFRIFILAAALVLNYHAVYNYFSLDDHYINHNNEQIVKGFAGIPEIFTSLYSEENQGAAFGYRPMVRASYAVEYQFTRDWKYNPYFSHAVNLVLYLLGLLLLYRVLRRLFRNYSIWYPFLVVLLFLAHPTHTEVVASLKNRDILLVFLFSFFAIDRFLKWADTGKTRCVVAGMIAFLLALLSKETAVAQLAVFPLVLYFFTDLPKKKLAVFSGAALVLTLVALLGPFLFLPDFAREIRFFENPLVAEDNFFVRLSTAFYILGWYLKMLVVPYPLGYYYGYNMIPVVNWANVWVWLSLLAYGGMAVVAFKGLKKKTLPSFFILYFFISISMYANIVYPVPGIVADRFMFFPSLAYSMAVIYLFFKLFRLKVSEKNILWWKMAAIVLLTLAVVAPYGQYTRWRIYQWKTKYSLYHNDRKHLYNSVKANSLYALELIRQVNVELSKPVNPFMLIHGMVDTATMYLEHSVKLDPSFYPSWNTLGVVYSKIYANQALIREKSYSDRDEPEKAFREKKTAEMYFSKADAAFRKAAQLRPDMGRIYFNWGYSKELEKKYDTAIALYQKTIQVDGPKPESMSRIANVYYKKGDLEKAIEQNKKIIELFPESDLPYVNLGNYYYVTGDTEKSLENYKKAVELGTRPEVAELLYDYYYQTGDTKTANYYLEKSEEARKKQKESQPE